MCQWAEVIVDTAAIEAIATRFQLPLLAVQELLSVDPEVLVQRTKESCYTPSNGTAPEAFFRYPMGSVAINDFGGDLQNRYISFLRTFDPHELVLTEAEDGIQRTECYRRYLEWSRDGIEPPYVNVFETDRGALQVANRRRTLVARELGKPLVGWFGPHNRDTDLPLKYGDVLTALKTEIQVNPQEVNEMKLSDRFREVLESVVELTLDANGDPKGIIPFDHFNTIVLRSLAREKLIVERPETKGGRQIWGWQATQKGFDIYQAGRETTTDIDADLEGAAPR